MADEILARDYTLGIRSCLSRGWAMLRGNFLVLVGVTALVMALLSFVSAIGGASFQRGPMGHDSVQISGVLGIIVWGPLFGGLYLYYLKKIRREKVTVETVFTGFSNRFLQLFLAGFVTSLLTWLGFLCLVLPGIYLLVAWSFTLPLVMDKQLDFWSAMELSRKVVTKHWWKFLGFAIVLLLLTFAGVLVFFIGTLITLPWVIAAQMHAYEDIFGQVTTPSATGPHGTIVVNPTTPPATARPGWTLPTKIAVVAIVAIFLGMAVTALNISARRHRERVAQMSQIAAASRPPKRPSGKPQKPVSDYAFGPVIERQIQARTTGTNQFLNLGTKELLTPSDEITNALAGKGDEDEMRFWEALDIPQDSNRFQYIDWLRETGADLMFAGDGKIIGFDGIFSVAHGSNSTTWNDWDSLTPEQVRNAVNVAEWTQQTTRPRQRGDSRSTPPKPAGVFKSATQLDSSEQGGPTVNLLTRDQSVTWFFKTREGMMGILQLTGFSTNDPSVAMIRYKLLQQTNQDNAVEVVVETNKITREQLSDRLEAASMMTDMTARDGSLTALATDAGSAGEVDIVKQVLPQITDFTARNQTALDVVRLLSKRGMKKEALGIARDMEDMSRRDQALAELAQ